LCLRDSEINDDEVESVLKVWLGSGTTDSESEFTQLGLTGNRIGFEGAREIAEHALLPGNGPRTSTSTSGDHDENRDEERRMRVRASRALEGVYISDNLLGPEGVGVLARALVENRSVKRFGSNRNACGDSGCAAFAPVIFSTTNCLQVIGLSGNRISDAGALALALAFQNRMDSPPLLRLFLNENCIGDAGAVALAEALEGNTTLQRLGLASNRLSCCGGRRLMELAEQHPSLERVCLFGNPFLAGSAFADERPTATEETVATIGSESGDTDVDRETLLAALICVPNVNLKDRG
jgi:Ran GTPase-activating protein (RanGAP) involved in mRNA processing and transport